VCPSESREDAAKYLQANNSLVTNASPVLNFMAPSSNCRRCWFTHYKIPAPSWSRCIGIELVTLRNHISQFVRHKIDRSFACELKLINYMPLSLNSTINLNEPQNILTQLDDNWEAIAFACQSRLKQSRHSGYSNTKLLCKRD